jgi:3-dehydroquinate synthase
MLARAWGRDVVIIGLGGGVVTDLAGFVAATYLRGVRYLSLPTSLLGMVDAALGGKTGVDTAHGKNLVGAFHQPAAVLADLRTLGTLPAGELDNGLAETVKHAMIADAALLDLLIEQRTALRELKPDVLLDVVSRSVQIKLDTVAADEQDHGVRQALNFGHTIGHALERVTDYALGHGQAVAIGACVEADAAVRAGLLDAAARDKLIDTLESLGLPTRLPAGVDRSALLDSLLVDKKNRGGEVRYALPDGVGRLASFGGRYSTTLPADTVTQALEARS